MKKSTLLSLVLLVAASLFTPSMQAGTYNDSETYTLDQLYDKRNRTSWFGLSTRFGYSFSDNGYFAYGASVYYTWNNSFGIVGGFDSYYGRILVENEDGSISQYNGPYRNFPKWDIRAGFMLGRYLSIGGIYGKCNVCFNHNVVHRWENNGVVELGAKGMFYGGFITAICPISTHLAMNMDVSYTTHTSFNVYLGVTFRFPVK